MRKRSKILIFFTLTVLLLLSLVFSFFIPNIYYESNKGKVAELNELLIKLDKEPHRTQIIQSANPLDILKKLQSMSEIQTDLKRDFLYKQQIEKIENDFRERVDSYYSNLEHYENIDELLQKPDLSAVDFDTKKDIDAYIKSLWPTIRTAYSEYNSTTEIPIRFSFDPEIEVNLLTTEEKIGLLFGFAVKGTSLTDQEQQFLSSKNIGTVALFGHNISGQEQVKTLTNQLQKTSTLYPFLISTDQEGGSVKRIAWDDTGSLKQIETLSDEEACEAWNNRSKTLFQAGINWNLGTIADVTNNTSSFIFPRIFSSDYEVTANEVTIASKCEGIISTIKHWPGHGSTTVDTHMQLGRLSVEDEETWLATDNLPFQAGIDNGAETIMVGQLLLSWLNNDKPATLSADAINYLRDDLNYQGAIVTDDMMMLTRSGYSIEDATREALIAGNDLIFVVNNDIPTLENLYNIALELFDSGQISEEDLNARAARILELKAKVANLSQ